MIFGGAAAKPAEPASKVMLQRGGMFNLRPCRGWQVGCPMEGQQHPHQGSGCLLEDTWEAQMPPPRFSCLPIAILLSKETGFGETL